MITIRKKIAWMALGFMAMFGSASSAYAQGSTIYKANADLQNSLIFTEISFASSGCQSYQLKFKLRNVTKGVDFGVQKIVAVLKQPAVYTTRDLPSAGGGAGVGVLKFAQLPSGAGTWEWNGGMAANSARATLIHGDTTMTNLKSTGYELAFALPINSNISGGDSLEICMVSIVSAAICAHCGIDGTDMVFTPSNILPACTAGANGYANKGNDLIACYQRSSKAANYEAWILDNRDCHPYRIVQMPDGRWWFAQNLNYFSGNNPVAGGGYATKSPTYPQWGSSAGESFMNSNSSLLKSSWCPGGSSTTGVSVPGEPSNSNNELEACTVYGSLYPWATAMSLDGVAEDDIDANLQFAIAAGNTGARRGVCPEGWYIPSRYDWGKMINTIEYNNITTNPNPCTPDGENAATGTPKTVSCFHNYKTVANAGWAGSKHAFKDLLSTDVGKFRGQGGDNDMQGTLTNYADTTRAAAFQPSGYLVYPTNKYNYATNTKAVWSYFLPETAGTDRYGFSIKPAGVRFPNGASSTFNYRGTFAGFWTSSHASATLSPQYATSATAFMVGFRYNYRHNADINNGIMSWNWDKQYGLAVRCIAQQ